MAKAILSTPDGRVELVQTGRWYNLYQSGVFICRYGDYSLAVHEYFALVEMLKDKA